MSPFYSLIITFLLKALEDEFAAHEPDMKELFVNEVSSLANEVIGWVNTKIDSFQSKLEDK